MEQSVIVRDLGNIEFGAAWKMQEALMQAAIQLKVANRELPEADRQAPVHHLLFCEHPHVYTLGKSGLEQNLLISEEAMKEKGISYYKINRGGDITYHGPGQIVGYPILDLDHFFTDIHKYLRFLEEMIIRTLAEYDIPAGRLPGATGVWLDPEDDRKARKICAMGIRCSRWITMHGFAFNVNTDLSFFDHIIPCGIDDKAVTSMQKELGRKVNVEEVRQRLKKHFAEIFQAKLAG